MSVATKPTTAQTQTITRKIARIWHAPISRWWFIWLALCLVFYGGVLGWYIFAVRTQDFPGPFSDPLRLFGIFAFVLVLATAAFTLRRRFVRGLPGKVQNWLWMHICVGITTVLVAVLHENFEHITKDFCTNVQCFTGSHMGTLALYGLIFLVLSGVIGRLLDILQARTIARDASTNGVGIVRALEERILELEYVVERLCAGKSEPFKDYCLQALGQESKSVPQQLPMLVPNEQADFQQANQTLAVRANLIKSLATQNRARMIISIWRYIHMVLATLAVLVILYHGIMELLSSVFNIIK